MTDEQKAEEYAEVNKSVTQNVFIEYLDDYEEIKQAYLDGLAEGRQSQIEDNFDEETFSKAVEVMNEYDNLQRENAELSNSVTELTNTKTELENKVTELEKQIQRMKCCGNCTHHKWPPTKESLKFCLECKQLDEAKENFILTKWKLAE